MPAQTRLEPARRRDPPTEPADGQSPGQPGDHVPVPNSDDHRSGPDGGAGADGGLVGRQAMIGELADVLTAAGRSEGGAVVLHGPAGIGKSSLLAVAESAGRARGMLVLTAKGARTESDLPFAGLEHGAWLRRTRRPVAARQPLRIAAELFGYLGIGGWVSRARAELEATGEASRESRPAACLTPQEWQIAKMAAAGLTNREIGEQLLISRRTVGSHLYHLFPKLGVSTRSQLAAALSAAERGNSCR